MQGMITLNSQPNPYFDIYRLAERIGGGHFQHIFGGGEDFSNKLNHHAIEKMLI